MSMRTEKIGISGYGSFGAFMVEKLSPYFEIYIQTSQDPNTLELPKNVKVESLKAVAECDVIIPCIPLVGYKDWIRGVEPYLRPDTLVIDVCSVKVKPIEFLERGLPKFVQILATHPLFGPESARDSLKGQSITVHPTRINPGTFECIRDFLAQDLGLEVIEMDPDTHDKKMALVHGLTFFISRGLLQMDLSENTLTAPSYKKLLALAEHETHHSTELFETIESGNPYSAKTRKDFINILQQLDQESDEVKF